ncbi:hypothetical protein [Pontibacter lucknowensis]|uniref:Uncharacterized protein n=1 Tax=Pontibacter lucknowensis TaxID=1077936 RepID=A0A1N7AQY7_9BACT|nr:hypothetical protein [Pontibacter lucknowensis]SIR41421.1 hypothetical protein SAMN05421545_3504 [Pontibacter lucknowensis]
MRKNTLPYLLLPLSFVAVLGAACQQQTDEEKTIASTHPKLEEHLQRDTVRMPITSEENPELYQRYRLRMEAYQSDEAFRVQETYKGRLAPLDEASHADVRQYRSALQEGLKQGINFAGRYTVVTVGCGTTCQEHYVVDRQDGKVLDKVQSSTGAQFSPDSRIFIVNPPDSSHNYVDCPYCEPAAYVLEQGKFRKLPQGQ